MSHASPPPVVSQGRSSPAGLLENRAADGDQDNVEPARQSPLHRQHQDRLFHTTNTLYRSPSAASAVRTQHAEAAAAAAPPHIATDDEIVQGLADDTHSSARSGSRVSRNYRSNDETANEENAGTFLPSRSTSRAGTGSILPPAAFFSPKRPPMSPSPVLLSPGRADEALNNILPHDKDHQDGRRQPLVSASSDSEQTQTYAMTSKASTSSLVANPALRTANQSIRRQQFTPHRPAMQRASSSNATPVIAKQNGAPGYKAHRGANRFFAYGLIMTSDDNPLPFLASLLVMIALPVLWFIFVAPYTWHHISPAPVIVFAYVFAVALTSMCVTAWRDPGVLPRDMDPDPPCTAGVDGGYVDTSDPLAIPLPRIVRVRNNTDLKVKWCDTCGTYRPPRSSHCRVCDNCVENIDHHCTFLNTCIGRRNYFTFFAFLIFSILACCLAIAFCVLHIYYLTRSTQVALPREGFGEGKSFQEALHSAPLSAVLFFLAIAVVVPLAVLLSYHIRLICFNRTTVEQIRINATHAYSEKPSYDDEEEASRHGAPSGRVHRHFAKCLPCLNLGIPGQDPNPFAHRSMLRNASAALLRPMTADSWIDRYRPTRVDGRRPNPGLSATHVAVLTT